MKRIMILVTSCFLCTAALAQSGDQAAMMKAMQDFMTPGDVHKMMSGWDGTWTTTNKTWMEPGGAPQVSTGTCVNTMVLGGRYQESKFSTQMMGMPYEGIGMMGYDNAKKKFSSTWVDNMGTGFTVLDGTWDAASKSIRLSGVTTDPETGKNVKVREVLTIRDDNNQLMEMWMTDPKSNKEIKMMEVAFVRK